MKRSLDRARNPFGLVAGDPQVRDPRVPWPGSAVRLLDELHVGKPVLSRLLLVILRDLPQSIGPAARAMELRVVPHVGECCVTRYLLGDEPNLRLRENAQVLGAPGQRGNDQECECWESSHE